MRKPNPRFADCPGWVVLVLAVFLGAPSTRQAAIAQSACFDYAQLPHLFGQVATPGQIQSMACRGDYIYVAAHTAGLHAIDARNAQQPLLQSTYDSDGEAYDVAISGTFAVLADGSRGLVVLNLGQPWNPVRVGWLDTVDHLRRVALAGDHAYFTGNGGAIGLVIVDLGDPYHPTQVGTAPAGGNAVDVAVAGQYAFVADANRLLYVYDVAVPTSPVLVTTLHLTYAPSSMAIRGAHLYVGSSSGIVVVDVATPSAPVVVGRFAALDLLQPVVAPIVDVAIGDDRGFFVNSNSQVGIFEFSDPAHPRILTALTVDKTPTAVCVDGNLICAAVGIYGVRAFKDNGFSLPAPLSALAAAADFVPGKLKVWANHAYVASDSLRVFDLDAPGMPARVATLAVGGALDIDIQDGFAYVLCVQGFRIRVFDLAQPAEPVEVASYSTAQNPRRLLAAGDVLYSGSHNGELRVSDITVPESAAFRTAQPRFVCIPYSLAVRGDRLYVGGKHSIQVIDISAPTMPVLLNSVVILGEMRDIVLTENRAYLAGIGRGLIIVDTTVPTLPELGTCELPAACDITLDGDVAYVCDELMGVAVVDIADETQPLLLGVKRGRTYAGELVGGYLLVSGTGYQSGLERLPLQCNGLSPVAGPPAALSRLKLAASPDPFNPRTRLQFSLDAPGAVDLTVHDIAGRPVRRLLVAAGRSAGDHTVTWDGRDDNGRLLPSGKYFCRLRAGAEAAARAVVLLK